MAVGAVYRAEPAHGLSRLGYGVEKTDGDGRFEIAAVPGKLPASMGQKVTGEVHAPPLPGGAKDPGHRGLQSLVVVGDHQLHAAQAAPDE